MADPDPQALLEAELRARRDMMPPSLAHATWQLVLGEAAASLGTLRAVHAAASQGGPGDRAAVALLVGDRDAARREASAAVERAAADWVPGWRQYQAALMALVAGDQEGAARFVTQLEDYARTHDRLPSGPPTAVAEVPAGILARDAARVAAGVGVWLAWHLRSARSRSGRYNSAGGVICLEAIVALLVASERGLVVDVERQYRRAPVPLAAVCITQWEGVPLDRVEPLSLETDLVAGPWLESLGVELATPGPGATGPRAVPGRERAPSKRAGDLEPGTVLGYLRKRLREGRASGWQLISWALMVGDILSARRQLQLALAAARDEWERSRPAQGGVLRRFLRNEEVPNSNLVREHFGLALAAGDDRAIEETGRQLRAWMDAVEEDERRVGRPIHRPYEHVAGYLDYLADVLGPAGPRAGAEQISTIPRGPRAACVGLEARDAGLVERGLNAILDEHARSLERLTSPPAPLSRTAIELAAAARRLGMAVVTDPKYATHPVPIEVAVAPGPRGPVGRVPADLLGRDLFAV